MRPLARAWKKRWLLVGIECDAVFISCLYMMRDMMDFLIKERDILGIDAFACNSDCFCFH
jgi:hypothetical protein